jgi:hypothetical protein
MSSWPSDFSTSPEEIAAWEAFASRVTAQFQTPPLDPPEGSRGVE